MGSRCWTPASSGFSPTHQRYWSYLDLLVENDWLLSQQGGTFLCQSATNHTSLRIAWAAGAQKPSTPSRNRLACEPGQVKKHLLRSPKLVMTLGLCIPLSRLYNGAANIILVPRITKDRREDVPWELEAFHSFQTFEMKSSRAVVLKSVLE